MRSDVFPLIRGRSAILSGQNEKFNHLKALASDISMAQPDHYDGSRPAQLNARVRSDLAQYIIPCNQTHRPLLPNHFTELNDGTRWSGRSHRISGTARAACSQSSRTGRTATRTTATRTRSGRRTTAALARSTCTQCTLRSQRTQAGGPSTTRLN